MRFQKSMDYISKSILEMSDNLLKTNAKSGEAPAAFVDEKRTFPSPTYGGHSKDSKDSEDCSESSVARQCHVGLQGLCKEGLQSTRLLCYSNSRDMQVGHLSPPRVLLVDRRLSANSADPLEPSQLDDCI